ncbi:hypothetical protein [Homoserinimonas hongtaonis]|uniref:hypothetical protein n=1 Tax=Homoserinimonas hongtaonis TaxID=2079791 RepID=UPI001F53E698|nr:hypothetical protein [Salinibacterium hongtaonis]
MTAQQGAWQTACVRLVDYGRRHPAARRFAISPFVARPGYWLASVVGFVWAAAMSRGRIHRRRGVLVATGCPRWSFGRGGTTIGAVYLTRDATSDGVLDHEAVHRRQWRTYGLAFIPLYFAAGLDAHSNRFEIEAGLERGGYR